MTEVVDISVDFAGVRLANPVFTASGPCGYADELADFMDISCLGGFITKSITKNPRKGNATPRIVETDSGMLNAIGLANIGLDKFIEEKLPLLENTSAAVFVNVAGETIDGRTFDGRAPLAIFPGDLPAEPDLAVGPSSRSLDVRFVRFAPPKLSDPRLPDPGQPPWPHIRLDRAIEFLIGDYLR